VKFGRVVFELYKWTDRQTDRQTTTTTTTTTTSTITTTTTTTTMCIAVVVDNGLQFWGLCPDPVLWGPSLLISHHGLGPWFPLGFGFCPFLSPQTRPPAQYLLLRNQLIAAKLDLTNSSWSTVLVLVLVLVLLLLLLGITVLLRAAKCDAAIPPSHSGIVYLRRVFNFSNVSFNVFNVLKIYISKFHIVREMIVS